MSGELSVSEIVFAGVSLGVIITAILMLIVAIIAGIKRLIEIIVDKYDAGDFDRFLGRRFCVNHFASIAIEKHMNYYSMGGYGVSWSTVVFAHRCPVCDDYASIICKNGFVFIQCHHIYMRFHGHMDKYGRVFGLRYSDKKSLYDNTIAIIDGWNSSIPGIIIPDNRIEL